MKTFWKEQGTYLGYANFSEAWTSRTKVYSSLSKLFLENQFKQVGAGSNLELVIWNASKSYKRMPIIFKNWKQYYSLLNNSQDRPDMINDFK